MIYSFYDSILETSRILEVQVDLASFGLVRLLGRGADVGHKGIEAECHNLLPISDVNYLRHGRNIPFHLERARC